MNFVLLSRSSLPRHYLHHRISPLYSPWNDGAISASITSSTVWCSFKCYPIYRTCFRCTTFPHQRSNSRLSAHFLSFSFLSRTRRKEEEREQTRSFHLIPNSISVVRLLLSLRILSARRLHNSCRSAQVMGHRYCRPLPCYHGYASLPPAQRACCRPQYSTFLYARVMRTKLGRRHYIRRQWWCGSSSSCGGWISTACVLPNEHWMWLCLKFLAIKLLHEPVVFSSNCR